MKYIFMTSPFRNAVILCAFAATLSFWSPFFPAANPTAIFSFLPETRFSTSSLSDSEI